MFFWVEFDSSPEMSNDLSPGSLLLSEKKHMFFCFHVLRQKEISTSKMMCCAPIPCQIPETDISKYLQPPKRDGWTPKRSEELKPENSELGKTSNF